MRNLLKRLNKLLSIPVILLVSIYRFFSRYTMPKCRFYPSCSKYALEAVKTYGPFYGTVKAAWRVVRCNPLNDGGYDPLK